MKIKMIFLSLLLFVLSGCIQQDTNVVIDADGVTKITQTFLVSEEVSKQAEKDGENITQLLEESLTDGIEADVKVNPINKDGKEGLELTHTFSTIEEAFNSSFFVSDEVISKKVESPWDIQIRDDWFVKMVNIHGWISYNEWLAGKPELNENEKKIMQSLSDEIDLRYSISIPVKAKKDNADESNGRTYTWVVENGEEQRLQLFYHHIHSTSVLIGLGVVFVFVYALFYIWRKTTKK